MLLTLTSYSMSSAHQNLEFPRRRGKVSSRYVQTHRGGDVLVRGAKEGEKNGTRITQWVLTGKHGYCDEFKILGWSIFFSKGLREACTLLHPRLQVFVLYAPTHTSLYL